ncbi:MAG TPA: hypothetical protein VIG08_04590, partial [Gemmatimonadales bacterium]
MLDRATFRRALTAGLTAGVAMLYLCAVGLVEAFVEREVVTGYVTLGRVMLFAPPLLVGYWIGGKVTGGSRQVLSGLVAGLAGGVLFAMGFLIATALSPGIREVLLRITPALLSFIAFGLDPLPGAVLNVAVAAALGLIGAGSHA